MGENPQKKSLGRGSKLLSLFHSSTQEIEQASSIETESVQSRAVPIVRGRGSALLSLVKDKEQSLLRARGPSGVDACTKPVGTHFIPRVEPQSQYKNEGQNKQSDSIGDAGGVLGRLANISIDEQSHTDSQLSDPVCKQGTTGQPCDLSANYINIAVDKDKGMFMYEVKFSPDIDSRAVRRKLLNQHTATIGPTKTFDGMIMHLPMKLNKSPIILKSEHPMDGSTVDLTIIFKKQQFMHENIQFFNILFRRIMKALKLTRIGHDSFNPACSHPVTQHKLEVWPGYVTAINEYEGGLKLNIDVKHRVLRTCTVRDLMTDAYRRRADNYKDVISSTIMGITVITRYNNKTYKIDDIAWDKNPKHVFELRNGNTVSMIDYYKQHWALTIEDVNQPLLVNCCKEYLSTGERIDRMIFLVPELCYITGLTDDIRSDFRIMKDLNSVMVVSPNERRDSITKFINQIQTTDVTHNILAEWGLKLDNNITTFKGRILPKETLIFNNNRNEIVNQSSDWIHACRNGLFRECHLKNWYLVHTRKDTNVAREFAKMLKNVAAAMKISVYEPHTIALNDDRTDNYLRELRKVIQDSVDMVVIIFPTNRTDRYSSVKKLCCVDMPIPSQCIMTKTISRADKLKSVTEKIALQINCKLGGALWALDIPFKNCMICGIDVFHAGENKSSQSVAAFVSSMDRMLTKWNCKVCIQQRNQELIDLLQICLRNAINAYNKINGCYPDRIIIYRDGVSDGQMDAVVRYEIKQLKAAFTSICPDYKPQLAILLVQKRINTRIFHDVRGRLQNPPPGTIADSEITKRNYYDFFLVSQFVRQGTVSPTHYIVICDETTMKPDHMQRISYKLCHLYYNWTGTIRVPAPCQYAHKLAYLVGQNLQTEPNPKLTNTLFYL